MTRLKWAPRVPMEWIQRLYDADATGVVDDELIDKVGYRLYDRCRDCIAVVEAAVGRCFVCPMCRSNLIVSGDGPDRELACLPCGWTNTWEEFHRSWRHLELAGPIELHEEFVHAWEDARDPRTKMLAIDRVIHRWHREEGHDDPRGIGRPLGVNLIEGNRKQVIAFLERLSAGENHDRWSTIHAEVEQGVARWRER